MCVCVWPRNRDSSKTVQECERDKNEGASYYLNDYISAEQPEESSKS